MKNLRDFSLFLKSFGESVNAIFSLLDPVLKNVSGLKSENKDLKEQMEKTHHEYLVLIQMLSNVFVKISELEVNISKKN